MMNALGPNHLPITFSVRVQVTEKVRKEQGDYKNTDGTSFNTTLNGNTTIRRILQTKQDTNGDLRYITQSTTSLIDTFRNNDLTIEADHSSKTWSTYKTQKQRTMSKAKKFPRTGQRTKDVVKRRNQSTSPHNNNQQTYKRDSRSNKQTP